MNRRSLLATVAAALTLPLVGSTKAAASSARGIQTTVDLIPPDPRGYGAIGTPGFTFAMQPSVDATDWTLPGSAATASARAWHGDLAQLPIIRATWRLVWNPMGNAAAGAQLAHVLEGYRDWTPVAAFDGRTEETPIHTYQDVTAALTALQNRREMRYLVHRIKGQPIIFASSLEVIWALDVSASAGAGAGVASTAGAGK